MHFSNGREGQDVSNVVFSLLFFYKIYMEYWFNGMYTGLINTAAYNMMTKSPTTSMMT